MYFSIEYRLIILSDLMLVDIVALYFFKVHVPIPIEVLRFVLNRLHVNWPGKTLTVYIFFLANVFQTPDFRHV